MFKIHVCSKTIVPLFYIVIEIMHISRLLNQHKKLTSSYQWLVNFFKCVKLSENYIALYYGH